MARVGKNEFDLDHLAHLQFGRDVNRHARFGEIVAPSQKGTSALLHYCEQLDGKIHPEPLGAARTLAVIAGGG